MIWVPLKTVSLNAVRDIIRFMVMISTLGYSSRNKLPHIFHGFC